MLSKHFITGSGIPMLLSPYPRGDNWGFARREFAVCRLLGLPQPALLRARAAMRRQEPNAENVTCLLGRGDVSSTCGAPVSMDGEHLLHCRRGCARHARHKAVVNALVPVLREAEYQVFVEDDRVLFEPRPPAQGGPRSAAQGENLPHLRSDILAVESAGSSNESMSLCIDVAIVDATRADMISRGSSAGRLCAAGLEEEAKRRKYGRPVDRRRVEFSPFVVESHGALGKAAQQVVKKLAKRIVEKRRSRGNLGNDWAPRVQQAMVANAVKQSIAVALQRSQASFVLEHAQWLVGWAGVRHTNPPPPQPQHPQTQQDIDRQI